jgi:hypothetical protein
MEADAFDGLVRPFAAAIYALSTARSNGSLELTKFQDARFREAIATLIRKACDVIYPALVVPEVSVAADAAAKTLGIDLRQETWHSQKRFDPGYKVFHYEHMQPVGAILALASRADSVDGVLETLRRELRLVWITKEEDKALNALGFASKRPNPDEAYEAAGIELVRSAENERQTPRRGGEQGDRPGFQGQASNQSSPPRRQHRASSPPAAGKSGPEPVPRPHEPGFMPVSAGDTFRTAQLGLCLGRLVRIYTEEGASVWSVGNDQTLFESQCRAFLARTAHGAHGFREAGLFNAATGTLLLQPRFPNDPEPGEGSGSISFQASPIQLAPPAEPEASWSADLQTLLATAVRYTVYDGGQLRVETGGWDAPAKPFCSIEIAHTEDRTPVLLLEASPAPTDSRWWKDRMRPVNGDTARLLLRADDFNDEQAALLLRDAMDWDGFSPWELVLTYAYPPKGVVTT